MAGNSDNSFRICWGYGFAHYKINKFWIKNKKGVSHWSVLASVKRQTRGKCHKGSLRHMCPFSSIHISNWKSRVWIIPEGQKDKDTVLKVGNRWRGEARVFSLSFLRQKYNVNLPLTSTSQNIIRPNNHRIYCKKKENPKSSPPPYESKVVHLFLVLSEV